MMNVPINRRGTGMRRALVAASFAFLAVPAAAQSMEEAARSNTALALTLCISSQSSPEARVSAFQAAGFQASVTRSTGNSDTDYVFTDPAGTTTVNHYFGEMPESCRVTSHTLGVTAASEVLDWIVPQILPGFRREVSQGPVNPTTGQPAQCVRYVEPDRPIPFVIGVGATDSSASCVDTGASVLFSFSAV